MADWTTLSGLSGIQSLRTLSSASIGPVFIPLTYTGIKSLYTLTTTGIGPQFPQGSFTGSGLSSLITKAITVFQGTSGLVLGVSQIGTGHGTERILLLPSVVRGIMVTDKFYVIGSRDAVIGNSLPPSLRLDSLGSWRFRWTVAVGTRTMSVFVKQAVNLSPRPTLIVKANPEIGVNSDVTVTAGSGSGFVLLGPATINPTVAGAVWVELHNNYDGQTGGAPCYFDDIGTT